MKLTTDQLKKLKEPLPPESIKEHPTKKYLSSIKAIYVVERLNDVFGTGSWHLRSEVIDNKTAMIVVKAVLTIPEYEIELESYGGNDNGGENSKNFDLGDAYKGAVTDALTKICSYLGIGMDVYKGLRDQPKQTTAYNHQELGSKEKPLISNAAFKQAMERIGNGEATLIKKIKDTYTLEEKQLQIINEAADKLKLVTV